MNRPGEVIFKTGKHERLKEINQMGIDLSYKENKHLESREMELLEREKLEDEILLDSDEFERLALLYARESMAFPLPDGFLDFGVNRLRRERDSQFKEGWR